MTRHTRTSALVLSVLLGSAGVASATDQSTDIWHYLAHEGFVNGFPTLSISVHDGVATLSGQVVDSLEKRRFGKIVLRAPGVAEVRNLVDVSD